MTSRERAAHNEVVFRDANERVRARAAELSRDEGRAPFLCECEDPRCEAIVRLSLSEYEAVRAGARQFFIAPGHPVSDGEIAEHGDRYCVVRKTGTAGAIAQRTDPRS